MAKKIALSDNIDLATLGVPAIGDNTKILENIGNKTTGEVYTPEHTGWLIGQGIVDASGGGAYISKDGNCAGINYIEAKAQFGICVPVRAGELFYIGITGNARFENLQIREPSWG